MSSDFSPKDTKFVISLISLLLILSGGGGTTTYSVNFGIDASKDEYCVMVMACSVYSTGLRYG